MRLLSKKAKIQLSKFSYIYILIILSSESIEKKRLQNEKAKLQLYSIDSLLKFHIFFNIINIKKV